MALLQAWGQVQVCTIHLTVGPGQKVAAIRAVFFLWRGLEPLRVAIRNTGYFSKLGFRT